MSKKRSILHQLKNRLDWLTAEELRQCLIQCADESETCRTHLHTYLRQRFPESVPVYDTVRQQVRSIFHGSNSVVRDDNPRRWNREWRTNWDLVLTELDLVLTHAESWVKADNAEPALGAVLQTLAELASSVDAEVHHGYVGGVYECAERVQKLLRAVVQTRSLSVPRLSEMLQELRQLAVAPNLAGDGLELTSLFLWCCERCLKREGTLGMLDSLMDDPANAGDWQKLRLLEYRVELLKKWGQETEIPSLIRQYLHIPEVRRREVERLMQAQQWEYALQLVEEGLQLAEKSHAWDSSGVWNDLKIKLLKKLNKPADALKLCRKRFVENGACMEDYRELKRLVPPGEWKNYLKCTVSALRGNHTYALLPIYTKEGMQEELAAQLRLGKTDVSTMVTYMLKLQPDYLPDLLPLFEQQMNDCLRVPTSREMYAQYAALLQKARKISGANDLIDRMLEKYRTQYPRRTAMLEEFRKVQENRVPYRTKRNIHVL